MYLFCISHAVSSKPYVMARIERNLKNLRMTYNVEDIEIFDSSIPSSQIAEKLSAIYNNRNYVIITPRFSQVGRPKVMVQINPRLFINLGEKNRQITGCLRKMQIPVESVHAEERQDWQENESMAFGGEYRMPLEGLFVFLKKIHSDGRLFFKDNSNIDYIHESIVSERLPDDSVQKAAVISAAISVWFGENRKQVKTHSAGGRVRI